MIADPPTVNTDYNKLMLTVYTRQEGCAYCDQAKALLRQYGVPYTEKVIGVDISVDAWREANPFLRTVPQVFRGEHYIGNFTDLKAYLEQTKGMLQ